MHSRSSWPKSTPLVPGCEGSPNAVRKIEGRRSGAKKISRRVCSFHVRMPRQAGNEQLWVHMPGKRKARSIDETHKRPLAQSPMCPAPYRYTHQCYLRTNTNTVMIILRVLTRVVVLLRVLLLLLLLFFITTITITITITITRNLSLRCSALFKQASDVSRKYMKLERFVEAAY